MQLWLLGLSAAPTAVLVAACLKASGEGTGRASVLAPFGLAMILGVGWLELAAGSTLVFLLTRRHGGWAVAAGVVATVLAVCALNARWFLG